MEVLNIVLSYWWLPWVTLVSVLIAAAILYAWRKMETVFGTIPSPILRAMLRIDKEKLLDGKTVKIGPSWKYRLAVWVYLNTVRRIKGEPARWESAVAFFARGHFKETVTTVRDIRKRIEDALHGKR